MNQENESNTVYDIIGDVHGYYDQLKSLLEKLGYAKQNGTWTKPGHKAVFVGDLIDKGPAPASVLTTVRSMVDSGNALMVIGNHELNWIQDAADHTHDMISFLDATDRHRCRQKMTNKFKYEPEKLLDLFHWLRKQPLYIEQNDLRIVHACWNKDAIATLKQENIQSMDSRALAGYRETYSDIYLAIDLVVAGCAHRFPTSKRNTEFLSDRKRIMWWPENNVSINPVEIQPEPLENRDLDSEQPPIFFGHYALVGTPDILGRNVAGVDYSVAYGGSLTAYRYVPGTPLHRQQFVT
ncbi:metallophosphoesterase [Marinobacter sp.]|uniref:metallophosphoesterase n=1 Tax=Marinobacter sp. TaxID=50741 RepID=UPI003A91FD37